MLFRSLSFRLETPSKSKPLQFARKRDDARRNRVRHSNPETDNTDYRLRIMKCIVIAMNCVQKFKIKFVELHALNLAPTRLSNESKYLID